MDIDLIHGEFGQDPFARNKSDLIALQGTPPNAYTGEGALSSGYFHPKTFFGPRAGMERPEMNSSNYFNPDKMGFAPNRWMGIADWSSCLIDLLGSSIGWEVVTEIEEDCFRSAMSHVLMRLPQGMCVVDQNMTREDMIAGIYSSWPLD